MDFRTSRGFLRGVGGGVGCLLEGGDSVSLS